jgi:Uma2 family endonuclease
MASIETHIVPKPSETKKTLEESLQREERALHKHQFINGKIISMAGGKSNHNLIATNLTFLLKKLTQPSDLKYMVLHLAICCLQQTLNCLRL